jgi:hypothetical protein
MSTGHLPTRSVAPDDAPAPPQRPGCRCLTLIPVGPGTDRDFLKDTLDSVYHYIDPAELMVAVLDDSRAELCASLEEDYPESIVLKAPSLRATDWQRPAFDKLLFALRVLLARVDFDVCLRMDTDALVIGANPHRDAIHFLEQRPDVGMVGAFTIRGDGTDKADAMAAKGKMLVSDTSWWRTLLKPKFAASLNSLMRAARQHGYRPGDMCTGGALLISRAVLERADKLGFLNLDGFGAARVGDDCLLSLLTCACGFRLADMPDNLNIFAVNWHGIPMPPEELVAKGKKIVHPVRTNDPAVEPKIRLYFRKKRLADLAVSST